MPKNRVIVYGPETNEKRSLMEQLSDADLFQFESDTDYSLYRSINEGLFSPKACVPLQLLLLNIDDDEFQSPPVISRNVLGCDLRRAVILILHEANPEKNNLSLAAYQSAFQDKDNIQLIHSKNIEDITVQRITSLLQKLEEHQQAASGELRASSSF